MNKYEVSIRTISRIGAEYRKENMLILKHGETFNFLTLNLKAKHPLSGFITGKPQPKDIIVKLWDEPRALVLTVGAVDQISHGLSEVELVPEQKQESKYTRVSKPGVFEW